MFRAPLTRTCLLVSCLVSPVVAAQDEAPAPVEAAAPAPVVEKKPAPVESKKVAEEAPAAAEASATDKPAAAKAEVPQKAATEPDKSAAEPAAVEAAAGPVVAPTPKKPRAVKAAEVPTPAESAAPVKAAESPKPVEPKSPAKAAEKPGSTGSTVTAGGTASDSLVVPAKATPSPDLPPAARPIPPGPGQVEERALAEAQRFFSGVLAGDARLITGRAGYPFTLETQTYHSPDALLPEWIRHLRAIRSDLLTLYGIEILTPDQMEEKYGKPPARLAALPYKGRNSYVAIANISGRAAVALLRDTPNGMLVMGFSD